MPGINPSKYNPVATYCSGTGWDLWIGTEAAECRGGRAGCAPQSQRLPLIQLQSWTKVVNDDPIRLRQERVHNRMWRVHNPTMARSDLTAAASFQMTAAWTRDAAGVRAGHGMNWIRMESSWAQLRRRSAHHRLVPIEHPQPALAQIACIPFFLGKGRASPARCFCTKPNMLGAIGGNQDPFGTETKQSLNANNSR